MNTGTKLRTVLAVVIAFYTALIKVDVTDFGNDTVNLIYQILTKAATFAVIFIVTYYNNDYTEEAAIGTGITRQMKTEKKDGYIGDVFYEKDGEDDELQDMETD